MNRRTFIAGTGAATAATLSGCSRGPRWGGAIVGGSHAKGHRLREGGGFPEPTRTERHDVVIVGGGIAGLTAGYRLEQAGTDFVLLDLEAAPGGTAASGVNSVSAYPWGAHYLPIPNAESTQVLALLQEFGVITGYDSAGLPAYDETMLCSDPEERLFHFGRWQEGILPQLGHSSEDRRQYERFFSAMDRYRKQRGSDGRRAFAIPLDLSSQDEPLLALDKHSMRAWLDENGFSSEPLRWYVDYCCRDDYGAGLDHISAWAGVHYFAARDRHAANAPHDAVLTWPEGNGWLAHKLAKPILHRIRTDSLAWKIENTATGVLVDCMRGAVSLRIEARAVVCATPRFVAQRIVAGCAQVQIEYSPWMVANLTLDRAPHGDGAPLAWDNVIRGSESLGYVVATHQNLQSVPGGTVLTHYWPLDREPPRAARERALARTYAEWSEIILSDLRGPHPDFERSLRHLDVWLWGHGMVRPVPGFIHGPSRAAMSEPHGRVFFAHCDMSGISIFEEACTRGAEAAADILRILA